MNQQEEIKPSFSLKYFFLVIFIAFMTAIIGYFVRYLLEKPPRKILFVFNKSSTNLIHFDKELENAIQARYVLTDFPNIHTKSFFRHNIEIKNEVEVRYRKVKKIF